LEALSTIEEIRGTLSVENYTGTTFPYLRNLKVVGSYNTPYFRDIIIQPSKAMDATVHGG
jgi:hypothetical protein